MDYKQLQFFLAVCEEKSISRAAEKNFVSQQAISKSLTNLEQELGVQLFVRTSSGVSLTEAGQLLERQARPHLAERDDILRQMQRFCAAPQLRIGFFMGLLQALPPHFFLNFQKEHPEVQLHYHSYTDNERSRTYRNHDCDLVITTSPLTSSDFVQLVQFKCNTGILIAQNHPLAQKQKLFLADLKSSPLISLNTENRSQCQLHELLKENGLAIDSILGDADWELTFDLLQSGFISFYAGKSTALPDGILMRYLEDMQLSWEFYIYGKRNRHHAAVQRELVRRIVDAIKPT